MELLSKKAVSNEYITYTKIQTERRCLMKELIPMDELGIFASKKNEVLVDSRWVAKSLKKA